jgi:uncharacterized membrane protein YgdD (TMEM256/DUF423 family)
MKPRNVFRIGALLLALAIAAGAFGAHGLKGRVTVDKLETFEIGVRYQFYNALGLMAAASWLVKSGSQTRRNRVAVMMILIGTAIFSGTLYGIVVGGPRWLGAITPIGGTLQIIGWVILAGMTDDTTDTQ